MGERETDGETEGEGETEDESECEGADEYKGESESAPESASGFSSESTSGFASESAYGFTSGCTAESESEAVLLPHIFRYGGRLSDSASRLLRPHSGRERSLRGCRQRARFDRCQWCHDAAECADEQAACGSRHGRCEERCVLESVCGGVDVVESCAEFRSGGGCGGLRVAMAWN